MAEYKLLDPNRKTVLRLPHLAFKLWHAYWMFESDDQEAYPSLEVLEEATGMDRKTIIKWRKWLVKHGWLLVCGGTAAERYSKATQGAHKVLIYRVDDPTKDASSGEFPLPNQLSSGRIPLPSSGASQGVENLHQEHSGKSPPKVSASASAFASSSSMSQATTNLSACGGCDAKPNKVFDLKDEKQEQQQQQKQRPRRLRLVEKYDEPFPVGFNDDPSEAGVKFRAEWCEAHRLDKPKEAAPAPANPEPLEMSEPAAPSSSAPPTPPPSSVPPPAHNDGAVKAKFNSPVCDYSHKYGSEVADHIEGGAP